MTSSGQSHGASASGLGYLYQSQWPLVELLRRAGDEPDSAVTLELYDDVSWEEDGTPTELLQLKHHVNATGNLGDKDDDLWRTIRVWMDAHPPGDPSGPTLTLVTTQTAATGTAAAALRAGARDPATARRLLEAAARESTAQASLDIRQRFRDLPDADRAVFVDRIHILDSEPSIGADPRGGAPARALPRPAEGPRADLHRSTLGWWHRVAVNLLRGTRGTVTALDLKAKIDELRNAFAGDNLFKVVGFGSRESTISRRRGGLTQHRESRMIACWQLEGAR